MAERRALSQLAVAISVSENADLPMLGLAEGHLRDAMAEIARYLLAVGARLAYGGDLRVSGFTELLFELVARHGREADNTREQASVLNYLAWPVHIQYTTADIRNYLTELTGSAELNLLSLEGHRISCARRLELPPVQPTDVEWSTGLTAMRKTMREETAARIVLGGRTEGYKGRMPGIAEEALLSLQVGQPLFLLGGFGGCARDVAETLGLISPWRASRRVWNGRDVFEQFVDTDLRNGLTRAENFTLVRTPHIDQAIALILRGLFRLSEDAASS